MSVIQDLIEKFREFPGIGPRQAKRFVQQELVDAIHDGKVDTLVLPTSVLPTMDLKDLVKGTPSP